MAFVGLGAIAQQRYSATKRVEEMRCVQSAPAQSVKRAPAQGVKRAAAQALNKSYTDVKYAWSLQMHGRNKCDADKTDDGDGDDHL